MFLPELCIKRPVLATVFSLVLVTLGLIFFTKLPLRGLPDIDPPIITVSANYKGADAFYMERNITTVIEAALKTVKNIDSITSTSSAGSSAIQLSFTLDADIEVALNDVRSKVSDISNALPKEMKPPSVQKFDSNQFASLWISVNSDAYDRLELTRIVSENIKTALEKLTSVGSVLVYGGSYYNMYIEPNPVKLYQHKVAPIDIENAVLAQNKDYPAGFIKTDAREFVLKLNGSLNKVTDFENIILPQNNNLNNHNGNTRSSILKLRDVATVELKPNDREVILRYNGKEAIGIGLVKQSKSNVIDLSKEVHRQLEYIRQNLPSNIDVTIAYDAAIPVNAAIKSVYRTVCEALILVMIVVYLFLGSARVALIPFVTVPVSLIATFMVMYFLGFSINTFTLLAMILAIGLVVDDAIVMLENIARYNEMGHTPMQAALMASKEISFAIVAMTITLAAVFLPVGFIEGFIGKLFIEFAWTLAFCVLFSGFVALTLTPMMSSRLIGASNHTNNNMVTKGFNLGKFNLQKIVENFNHFFSRIHTQYNSFLLFNLDNKRYVVFGGIISVLILAVSVYFTSKTFIPQEDEGLLQVIFNGPEGSSLKSSEQNITMAEKVMGLFPEILGYFTVIGSGGGEKGFAFISLKDWNKRAKSQQQIASELNAQFSAIPGMSIFAMGLPSLGGSGSSYQVEFSLQTSLEYEDLDKLSLRFMEEMRKTQIFTDIDRSFKSSTPTLDITVNRDKAYLYNVDLNFIGTTIQYLIAGQIIGDFRMGNDIYDVLMRLNKEDRNKVSSLSNILVKTNSGNILPLQTVANITEKISVKSYDHYNYSKSIMITANLNPGYDLKQGADNMQRIADQLIQDANSRIEYLGEIKRMQESNNSFLTTYLFALIFIYLVLAAQFESFTDPLLILISVPFSITGGILALWLFGNSLNMYSNIGLITLIGLVTKNAIMIVEFANQIKERGVSATQAIIEAAYLRFRPIMMTSTATVFGALPLVFAHGAGAAGMNSIGLVIVGGMIVGTFFTIIIIPVLYSVNFRNIVLDLKSRVNSLLFRGTIMHHTQNQ